jgi:hypothetical protein
VNEALYTGGIFDIRWWRRLTGLSLGAVAVILALSATPNTGIGYQAITLTISWAGALVATWRGERGIGGPATVYLIVLGLFHCGLIVAVALGGPRMLVGNGDNSWIFRSAAINQAVIAVSVCFFACAVGVLMGQATRSARSPSFPKVTAATPERRGVALVGIVGAALGISLIGYVVATNGGIGLLFSGYGSFLEAVGNSGLLGYGTILLGFGLAFLVSAGGRYRVAGWVLMGVVALIALPLGLRGTVLFPAVTLAVIESRRRRLPLLAIAVAGFVGLAVVSVLRQTRSGGVSSLLAGSWCEIAPLQGVAEMGYSLYPVVVVQGWMTAGTPPRGGITLIAPLIRLGETVFGGGAPPGASDFRLFNSEIANNVGAIGGSPIAEGIRNGGVGFAIVFLAAIGYLLARLDALPARPLGGAAVGVFLLPLLIDVRNSFAPVLFQWIIGVMMLLAAYVATLLSRRRGVE